MPVRVSANKASRPDTINKASQAQAMPTFVRNALGMLGQVSAKPQPGGFPLPKRGLLGGEDEDSLEHLLKLAAAAISRLQSHQLSSLAQTQTTAEGQQITTWQMELPLCNGQDIRFVQLRLQREQADSSHQNIGLSAETG